MMLPLLLCSNPGVGAGRVVATSRFLVRSCYSTQQSAASRPPLPPFNEQTALQKVKMAEAAWNTRDPEKVALAYTEDSAWRNRAEFVKGRDAIREFLRRKWAREHDYKLRKYLWAFRDNRISVCFEYEYRDGSGQWWRAYGNENWEFNEEGLMRKRIASINESPITEGQRRIAVDDSDVVHNSWLQEQGLSGAVSGNDFPLGGGSTNSYS
eukprot:GHRQ01003362.1.p1 GENE.GHRQ01003362.1~~GHRQ01003362.1.p1  ORF type:complete len:210 (+),score=60.09 GHRQ01003362.1:163-792(+)